MGPYCNFCEGRCFIYFPEGTPAKIRNAYKTATIIATCQAGQAYEKNKTGYCYSDIKKTIAKKNGKDPAVAELLDACQSVLPFSAALPLPVVKKVKAALASAEKRNELV